MPNHLNPPYAGQLVNLMATPERISELQMASLGWPSWDLTPRQLCDLELLINGGFSPLKGFMTRADYESTCSRMRLANGTIWPIPIVLDVTSEFAQTLSPGSVIALRDPEGVMLGALHVAEIWQSDRRSEAEAVYGTTSPHHPGVQFLLEQTHPWYIGGRLEGVHLPFHYDFDAFRLTPSELRADFNRRGYQRIVAFQAGHTMHRADQELTMRAAQKLDANLLIHPAVGMTKPGDAEYYVRMRCYQALLSKYPKDTAKLALLPLAMRMAGPREAVWHAIIRKNYGCTHFIVDQDHADPGSDDNWKPFYKPHAAQELLRIYQDEIGISMVSSQKMVYWADQDTYIPENEAPNGSHILRMSGTELSDRLLEGRAIPSWFTFTDVARELQLHYRPRHRQGFTLFFTGLSGSGKSTIANMLFVKLLEIGGRSVTLLDGDIVRKHLSSELGFSRDHRDINIRRIGFVASEITKSGGIAICAPIAPYDVVRRQVRALVQPNGGFILVHFATPLKVCECRDRKGLYAKARAGLVQHFTGISDPYEVPQDADIVVDSSERPPEDIANDILLYLQRERFIDIENPYASRDASYVEEVAKKPKVRVSIRSESAGEITDSFPKDSRV